MNPFKILLPAAAALALASCASNQSDGYDTSNPYGPADGSANNAPYQPVAPSNQTYDTPAAYEDAGASSNPNIPVNGAPPADYTPVTPPSHPTPSAAIANTHTVVKGDTLGGIARKYNVSIAAIKQANNMTRDIVVLGAKLKIPAAN